MKGKVLDQGRTCNVMDHVEDTLDLLPLIGIQGAYGPCPLPKLDH